MLDDQSNIFAEKNKQLNTAYKSLQRVEARCVSLNEVTREYLTRGDLTESLELLVAKAAEFAAALGGRFLHCSIENGGVRVTAVSKMCWADPLVVIEDPVVQVAFDEYAQLLMQATGQLLVEALEDNKTLILNKEQDLSTQNIPLPTGHPEIESLMLTPVSIAGKMLGVIALVNCPGGFAAEDEVGLEAFAAKAALLIHADSREIARAAAEETARLRSVFLANMSHELRTPLNIIIGMNQLLQGTENSKIQQDYLEKIGFSARQLLALVEDVLDLSMISEGQKMTLKETSFFPEELFYSVSQLLAFRQGDRKVELHVDVSREIPSTLIGDSLRLTQVLNNLLSNALKFTPQGTATLRVTLVEKTEDQAILGFCISDTGIGMSEEQLEAVFQPFVQADHTLIRKQDGSGLGLSISQQLCQLMGGKIFVDSRLGQGSLFRFELPFKVDSTNDLKMKPMQPVPSLCGMSVLIANSCPVCCDILSQILEEMQFKVDLSTSASGAMMLLNTAKEQFLPYQLVLVGQFLEEMTGLEFMQQLGGSDFPGMQKILLVNPADLADFSLQTKPHELADLVLTPVCPSDLFDTIISFFGFSSNRQDSTTDLSVHWKQTKVLLVDDNEMGRQVTRALLENIGIEVFEAKNGVEAIERVKADIFDLVLMDVQMPVLDGLSAARAIRALDKENIEGLPIIAVTAHAFAEHQAESLEAGMNDHLTKPINLETLYGMLQNWLPENKQQRVSDVAPTDSFEYADLAATLPGVDVNAGIQRVNGDRHLYINLLKKYIDQFSETETELHKELKLKQQEDAVRRIHTLKGVAGSLGVTALYKLAGELEGQLGKGEKLSALEGMVAQHNQFLAALKNLPERDQASTKSDKLHGSDSELQTILEQILSPLESLQVQNIKQLLEQIQKKAWSEKYSDQLVRLEEQVDRYQFSLATELVQNLLFEVRS